MSVSTSQNVLEARDLDENNHNEDVYTEEFGNLSVDAVYKVSARTTKGEEALRRGYIRKISDI